MVKSFTQLIKNNPSFSTQAIISHSQTLIENVSVSRRFHCIHAMDFERLGKPYSDLLGWNALVHVTKYLEEKGVLFCTEFRKRYFFDAALREWKLPSNFSSETISIQSQPKAEITFGCTNLAHFWQSNI